MVERLPEMSELIENDFDGLSDSESVVAYQYTDLQGTARAILAKATEVANNKIEQAKKNIAELEEIMRKQGYDKGFEQGLEVGEAEGRKNGEAAARAEFEKKVGSLNGILQHVLGELKYRKQSIQAQAEAEMLVLALEVARKIVRREVITDEKFVVPILMEAVALTNNKNDLIVKVNPEDHRVIEEEIPTLEAVFSDIGRVSISDDPAMQRGGVRVLSRQGEVDLSIEEQFAALERALIGDIDGLHEWSGEYNTVMPAEAEVTDAPAVATAAEPESPAPAPAPAVPATPAAAAPAVAEPQKPAEAVPQAKPKVEPTRRRRGPRTTARKPAANKPDAAANDTPAKEIPDTTTVHSEIDPGLQSSLSGVTDLNSLTLGNKEEELIKEILDSNIGEQND